MECLEGREWIVSHESALEFMRKANKKDINAIIKLRGVKPPSISIDAEELQAERFRDFTRPLHVLVGSGNARNVAQNLHCHVSSGEFPYGSFVMAPSGLIVSSPELCFLQMAGEIPFIELVRLGYEFCGSYRLDKRKGFCGDMPQLTNISKLKAYMTKSTGLYGRKTAIKALRFIADGSAASPMETILAMLLTLPYKYGGYGFPKPLLNYGIEVSEKVISKMGKPRFYCDLYWPDKKVAVEYDSDEHHTGSLRIERDSVRRNALTSADVTMITVSRRQLYDVTRLRELSEVLSKLLGKRLTYPVKEFASRNAELLARLLPDEPIGR